MSLLNKEVNKERFLGLNVGIVCFLSILMSSQAWSGKLYKWVDKNGQTHYSQIPPQKNQLKDANAIAEKSSASSIPATRKGDYAYCGGIRLPGPLYQPKSILRGLSKQMATWEKSLQRSEATLTEQLSDLSRRTYSSNRHSSTDSNIAYANQSRERRTKTARKIKEYRCALSWAGRQKEKYSDIKQEMTNDLDGAKTNYQAVLDMAHRDCGFEPKDYANVSYNQKKITWKKCMRPHDRKIRSSKRNFQKLRKLSNKLE